MDILGLIFSLFIRLQTTSCGAQCCQQSSQSIVPQALWLVKIHFLQMHSFQCPFVLFCLFKKKKGTIKLGCAVYKDNNAPNGAALLSQAHGVMNRYWVKEKKLSRPPKYSEAVVKCNIFQLRSFPKHHVSTLSSSSHSLLGLAAAMARR